MKRYRAAVSYMTDLYRDLRNPTIAAYYLSAALEDGDPGGILLAMHDIAKARRLSRVAEAIRVHRVSLHKMLRKNGNPSFRTFLALLAELDLELTASARKPTRRAA